MIDDEGVFLPTSGDIIAGNDPSARGIMQCLRLLADEADTVGMRQTTYAIRAALAACISEAAVAAEIVASGRLPHTLLH